MKYGNITLGQIEALINKLGGEDGVQKLLSGQAILQIIKHVIDLAVVPFCPRGWKVEEHVTGDPNFEWDSTKVTLCLDESQKDGKVINGTELRKRLQGQPVLNANVLDYLLAHSELIPEDWEGKAIFFWGTIYCDSNDDLSVRYLYWNGKQWNSNYNWLDNDWNDNNPALVSAILFISLLVYWGSFVLLTVHSNRPASSRSQLMVVIKLYISYYPEIYFPRGSSLIS